MLALFKEAARVARVSQGLGQEEGERITGKVWEGFDMT